MSKSKKTKIEKVKKVQKVLGPSKYQGSKKKTQSKKLKSIKKPEDKNQLIANNKNRDLKAKIKHLQKELKRIETFIANNSADKKSLNEKETIEQKINKLLSIKKKFLPDKVK